MATSAAAAKTSVFSVGSGGTPPEDNEDLTELGPVPQDVIDEARLVAARFSTSRLTPSKIRLRAVSRHARRKGATCR